MTAETAAPFVIDRFYNAPIARVWNAITDKDKMKHWYFDMKEFKPEVGFVFEFYCPNGNLHHCVVTEVIPGKKLMHSWTYPGIPGESFVTWELTEAGDRTRLRLTHAGIDTFPRDNERFTAESFAGGWNYITGTALAE